MKWKEGVVNCFMVASNDFHRYDLLTISKTKKVLSQDSLSPT